MSVWPDSLPVSPTLSGLEGELISVRITVEPRLLEDLLEALAELPFPVNPQIFHHVGEHPDATVEFPAYAARLGDVRACLAQAGFPAETLEVKSMIEELHAH